MNNKKITASVVLYNTPLHFINGVLDCILNSKCVETLYIVDNSPVATRELAVEYLNVEYIHGHGNIGYGAGHNIAFKRAIEASSNFHFVLNPDITFGDCELQKMISRIQSDNKVGQIMPKVINPDGSLQHLCKLLPSPLDLLLRRLALGPLKYFFKSLEEKFELRFTGYNQEMNVPFLSGCFMLFRVSALREIGIFDETFFMYGEDIDLTRRMHAKYKTLFFPAALITHYHAKQSYKNLNMFWVHSVNVARYFNKWGWFFDSERKKINADVLRSLEN